MKRFQRMAAVLALLAFVLAAGYLFYTCRQSSDIPRPEAEIRESIGEGGDAFLPVRHIMKLSGSRLAAQKDPSP